MGLSEVIHEASAAGLPVCLEMVVRAAEKGTDGSLQPCRRHRSLEWKTNKLIINYFFTV